jgi:hypothetical protein
MLIQAKKSTLTVVIGLALLAGVYLGIFAGNLDPPGAPAPTMKTLDEVEPRIPIASIPFTISSSGAYYLTGDLTAVSGSIRVEADDVSIDLRGFTISGTGTGNGIWILGRKNVEIRNGTVRDFNLGITEGATGEGHRVIDIRAVGNVGNGISLLGKGHLVKDCLAADNDDGIRSGTASLVVGNTVYNNDVGIAANPGNTIIANVVYANQKFGITLQGDSLVDQNTVFDNDQSGGGFPNIQNCVTCTFGVNHAP